MFADEPEGTGYNSTVIGWLAVSATEEAARRRRMADSEITFNFATVACVAARRRNPSAQRANAADSVVSAAVSAVVLCWITAGRKWWVTALFTLHRVMKKHLVIPVFATDCINWRLNLRILSQRKVIVNFILYIGLYNKVLLLNCLIVYCSL